MSQYLPVGLSAPLMSRLEKLTKVKPNKKLQGRSVHRRENWRSVSSWAGDKVMEKNKKNEKKNKRKNANRLFPSTYLVNVTRKLD